MTKTSVPQIDYSTADEIVARPATYYRMTRFIMVVVCFGLSPWFAYDGWVRYPQQNELAKKENPLATEKPNSDFNVAFQRVIAISLPFVGIALLGWTFYNSRGQYRMRGDIVSIPGHPDFSLDSIRAIDVSLWERKGIAYLEYEVSTTRGKARLDDFIYQRPPTDAIYDRIKKKLLPETAVVNSEDTPSADS